MQQLGEADKTAENSRQQQWVTNWLSRRYRVASDATDMLVSAAYRTAREIKLDPLLILSVMAIESRFNPFAESPVGAQGLMQVMSKVHRDKFEDHGGMKAALNPEANIRVGSLILKEYVTRGGSVEAGLKMYVGAGAMKSDFGYGAKVLAEYQRLQDVANGKKVSIYSTTASSARAKPVKQERKIEVSSESAPVDEAKDGRVAAL
jgi:soluble lytic murein transglycosylase-like protein